VVIDTDVAEDDWMAILYLLRHPHVSVKAITVTGTGEAHSEPGARHSLGLLALAGQPDIPVAWGTETPLGGGQPFPDSVREAIDNLMGLSLPSNPKAPIEHGAVELLISIVKDSPHKVTVLTLGPLTNLAEAMQAEPSLADNLEMIYMMGGAVDVRGNVFGEMAGIANTVAEWNIFCDPLAANTVFHSGAPITLVPLDATNDVPVTQAFCRRIEDDRGTPEADFVHRVLAKTVPRIGTGHYYFWDPLAAAILTDESLASLERRRLTVVVEEGPEAGRTKPADGGANMRVCNGADRARFETLFLGVLNGRVP
jgi:inosine-uridine nucleoside N-ribohydrolase